LKWGSFEKQAAPKLALPWAKCLMKCFTYFWSSLPNPWPHSSTLHDFEPQRCVTRASKTRQNSHKFAQIRSVWTPPSHRTRQECRRMHVRRCHHRLHNRCELASRSSSLPFWSWTCCNLLVPAAAAVASSSSSSSSYSHSSGPDQLLFIERKKFATLVTRGKKNTRGTANQWKRFCMK